MTREEVKKKLKRAFRLKIEYWSIEKLRTNPNNPRTHTQKQIAKLVRSIETFGFNMPIAIDESGQIIAGNAIHEAAKKLGFEEVPVIILDHLNETERRAYVIACSRLAEESGWHKDIYKFELEFLIENNFDVSATGLETPEIDLVISTDLAPKDKAAQKEDKLPKDSEIKPRVKTGDLWQVGKHIVFCGDALQEKSFVIVMGESKATCVFTDPPYNVKINGHVGGKGKIKHSEFVMASGEMTPSEFTAFLGKGFGNLAKFSADGSIHFLCMDWRHMAELMQACQGVYSELKNICVWNKLQGGMGSLYRSQHELVFVYKNGTAPHINNIELGKHGRYRTNVWDYKGIRVGNPGSLEDLKLHPTCKPVAMIQDAILDCSKPGDIILDCFGGSGSTLIAAEKTKRKARIIEYEPHYCDVIIHRFEKLFSQKATLIKNIENCTEVEKGDNNE